MNQERAVILLTILGIISGSSEGLWSIPDSNKYAISWLDIMYSDFKTEVHYRIEQKGEFYYSNKQEIDPELIQQLSESFTDFYENIDYEGSSIVPDYYEHLLYVEVYLINGKEMILGSDSDRYCYIPWNIIYEGKYCISDIRRQY